MSTANTISLLRRVIRDPNCERMNMSTIKGFVGELIVRERLEDAGFEVDHRGNQSGYDLSFWVDDQEFRIDVKTSTLKDELSCGRPHWGWALVHSNKKKAVSATHFICVGLDEDFEAQRFIIIPAEWAAKFPEGIGQLSKVKHGLCAFRRAYTPEGLTSQKKAYIEKCQKWLKHQRIKQLRKGQSFRNVFG